MDKSPFFGSLGPAAFQCISTYPMSCAFHLHIWVFLIVRSCQCLPLPCSSLGFCALSSYLESLGIPSLQTTEQIDTQHFFFPFLSSCPVISNCTCISLYISIFSGFLNMYSHCYFFSNSSIFACFLQNSCLSYFPLLECICHLFITCWHYFAILPLLHLFCFEKSQLSLIILRGRAEMPLGTMPFPSSCSNGSNNNDEKSL